MQEEGWVFLSSVEVQLQHFFLSSNCRDLQRTCATQSLEVLKPSSDLSLVFQNKLPCWLLPDVNSCLTMFSGSFESSLFCLLTSRAQWQSTISGSLWSLSLDVQCTHTQTVALNRVFHWLIVTWSVALFTFLSLSLYQVIHWYLVNR